MTGAPRPLDDEQLMAVLGAALAESDPVPDHVLEAAKAVPEIAHLDAELAQLMFDSDVELAGVRSGATATADRQLNFECDDADIEIVIRREERAGRFVTVIEGQVSPASQARVALMAADPATVASTTADELGRFRLGDVPSGAVRLLVHVDGVTRPIVTAWFRS